MYHEERVIDGKLCWRGTPDGEFKEYSQREMAVKFLFMQNELRLIKRRLDHLEVSPNA